jgi:flagellar biosynthesis/type III secretory pathway protein FliH
MPYLAAEKTVTLTVEQAALVEKALTHYRGLLDKIEEAAEEFDQAGFSEFYNEGEDKRYRSERLNIGLIRRKLTA